LYSLALLYVAPLALEFGLLLFFLFLLVTQGTQRGRHLLFIVFVIILFFASITISEVLYYYATPMDLVPEVFGPSHDNAVLMRSLAYMKAPIESIFLFILALSYMCVKSREQ